MFALAALAPRRSFGFFRFWTILFVFVTAALPSLLPEFLRRRVNPLPVRLRLAFERLGPTFIKFGQLIASTIGIVPERFSDEFQKCLDQVPPFPFEDVRRTVEEELHDTLENLYASVDPAPLASASIAQVHAVRLRTGEEAVIKVVRPRIEDVITKDIAVMRRLAPIAEGLFRRLRVANLREVVNEFERVIHEETDFVREAKYMDEYQELMAKVAGDKVVIPTVHWPLTSRRVLTMSRVDGIKVNRVEEIRAAGMDGEKLLRLGMRAWMEATFKYGLFHGDIHAGNCVFIDNDRCGFLDFGIMGRLDEKMRKSFLDFFLFMMTRDYKRLTKYMFDTGSIPPETDREKVT
ncbi:MAG: ABC1 kinase family protein, partial [Vicinamibacteria bacterium]